jgi:hypothetical protein
MKKLGNFTKLKEKFMKKPFVFFGFVLLIMLFASAANAGIFTLTFDGLQQEEQILNYYNGGLGGLGSGPGPNDGVIFSSSALALNSGNYGNNPSPPGVLFWLSSPTPIMDVPAGFNTGFSFYYAAYVAGSISLYSGLDGTGTLLATLALPVTPNPAYDWVPIGVPFSGTVMSVNFAGTANEIGFDNVTFGSTSPTLPEPCTMLLLGSGLVGLVAFRKKFRA